MFQKSTISGCALLALIMSLTSCNLYKEVEVTQVLEIRVGEITEEGFQAEAYLEFNNPNNYKVVLKKSVVDVFLEGNKIGELELSEKITIPKNSLTTQVLKMDAGYEQMQGALSNVLALLFKKEYLLEAHGYVKGRALIVSKKVDIDLEQIITREQLGF